MDATNNPFSTAYNLELKLYKALQPFLIICELFCVAPVGAHNFEPLQNHLWHYSLNSLHIIWCTTVYFCLFSCIYTEYTTFNISLSTIQKPLYFSEYLVFLIHILYLMTGCYYMRTSFSKCIQAIVAIDCKLLPLGERPYYGQFRTFFLMHLGLLAIYALATGCVDFFYSGREVKSFLRSMTVYLVPNLIINLSMVQYYSLMFGINLRCKSLASVLRKFRQQYAEDISKLSDPRKMINRLREIFSHLEILVKQVNSLFSISILIIYFGSFINISINIFLIYKYVDHKLEQNLVRTMYSVIWVALHIGKMFLILYHNHLIIVEKDDIAFILNDIHPHNDEMEVTIRRFLLQLMVDSRAHELYGLIQLNMSFIKSLLENMSVLVIFVIQYDVTFEALTNFHSTALTSRK